MFRKKHKKLKAVQSSEIRSHPNQKLTQVFIKITPSKNAPFQNRSLKKCIFKITFSKLLPQKRIFKITFIKIAPLKKYFFKIAPSSNAFSKLLPQKLHFQKCLLKNYIFKIHFELMHFQNDSKRSFLYLSDPTLKTIEFSK